MRFFENHQPRSRMPLSSCTRRRPHKYAIRVAPQIVETVTAVSLKEFERACDSCEDRIGIAQIGGYTNVTAEYLPAPGPAKEPKENPIAKRFGASLLQHRGVLIRSVAHSHGVGAGSTPGLGRPSHKHIARSTIPNCAFPSVPRCRTSLA